MSVKRSESMKTIVNEEKGVVTVVIEDCDFDAVATICKRFDDSNVDRYARYLHNLTKNTQFIVITHRRGTMAAADRLYGITMQEKGVSTLVSVDLIEKQLDEPDKNVHI